MTRVLMALPTYFPAFGGGPLRFRSYRPGLHARGIETAVLCGSPRAQDELHRRDASEETGDARAELRVHRVPLPERTGVRRSAAFFRALLAICADPRTRPDVIQLHSFERVEALYWIHRLKRLRIPIVYVIQIARRDSNGPAALRPVRALFRRVFYDQFDGLVTSSERILDGLRDLGVQTPAEVIANGVDLKRFGPRDPDASRARRTELGLPHDAPVVLTIGAVGARKGTHLVVDAWSRLLRERPDARLLLVGPTHGLNGADARGFAGELRRRIEATGRSDQVRVLGVRSDVEELYGIADVLVLPTDREGGTPNVVLESMASTCPVVLSRFLGQSSALGRPGIEFDEVPRRADPIAEAIERILSDEAHARRLARNGREWVRRTLDQEDTIDRFARVYRALERRGAGRRPRPRDTILDAPPEAGGSARGVDAEQNHAER